MAPTGGTRRVAEWVERGIRRFSGGDLVGLRNELDASPPEHTGVMLLDADVRRRMFAVGTPELVAVREQVERMEPPGSPLRAWADAAVAESLLVDGDASAFPLARAALGQLPDDPLAALPEAYTRARLLRVASVEWLAMPVTDGLAHHERLHGEAVAALLRWGLTTEVTVACGVAAGVRAIMLGDEPAVGVARLGDARSIFADDDPTLWPAVLDIFIGMVALQLHALDEARMAFDRLERAAPPGRMASFPVCGQAYLRLMTEGPTRAAVAMAHRVAEGLRDDPRQRSGFQHQIALLLADQGSEAALAFGHAALGLPAADPVDRIERDILAHRLAVLDGKAPPAAHVLGSLAELAAAGRVRPAGLRALDAAHDLAGAGHQTSAEAVRSWGLERLPPPAARSPAEARAARPLGEAALPPPPPVPAGTAPPALDVRVLVPRLEVGVDGSPVALRPTEATLLVLLAVAHPSPVHVEMASDALWPDRPPRRQRLNTVVHRLRQDLGAAGAAVLRRGPAIALDGRRCRVDLWDARQRLTRGPVERRAALVSVRGNLCDAELPYVEHLVERRHRFASEWLAHARQLVADGVARPAELAEPAASLGLDPMSPGEAG